MVARSNRKKDPSKSLLLRKIPDDLHRALLARQKDAELHLGVRVSLSALALALLQRALLIPNQGHYPYDRSDG